MALQQAVGATVSLSATLPASHDSTGFEALTFTKVTYANSLPDARGSRDVANFDDLETGNEFKFPDVYRHGSGTLTCGMDDDDAGQGILETAYDGAGDAAKVAIKMELADGTVYYRLAIVTSYMPTNISVGNVVLAEAGLEFSGETIKVAAA